jgi:hypothetical protein
VWRRNATSVTVRADVKDGEQVSVTKEIDPLLKDIRAALPAGYRVDVGGAVEGRQGKTRPSLPWRGDGSHHPVDLMLDCRVFRKWRWCS